MDRSSVRVTGPLARYASGFWEELAAQGYRPSSAQVHLLLMARLSGWLGGVVLDRDGLTRQRVDEFLRVDRGRGRRPRSAKGVVPLISYLDSVGVLAPVPVAVPTVSEALLDRFRRYLLAERGLAEGTASHYVYAGTLFLKAVDYAGGRDLGGLRAADVNEFVLGECGKRSVGSVKCVVNGLRSFLRFLHVQGITSGFLADGVPTVAGWSGSSLPRAISGEWVRRLLGSCDRRTALGRRDFAVITLLSRLGMRVGEVSALNLGDVDWRGGQILVRGKGSRLERLPLPVDVGEALADYVQQGRPCGECRSLFLRGAAPYAALRSTSITTIVYAACDRAGLPRLGAHHLRHTVASELLRTGAGLAEIGQVLRHRSTTTTAIYAKVDTAALRQLARPWPGGGA